MNPLPTTFLLDSSVLVKWFSPEADHLLARRLRQEYLEGACELIIPDLALYEVGNALCYSGCFAATEIALHVLSIVEMELTILPLQLSVLEAAIELSLARGIAVYDGYFVTLAEATGTTCVTADEKLYRKVQDLEFVRLLRDFA